MDSDSDSNPDSRFLVPITPLLIYANSPCCLLGHSLTSWIRIRIRIQSSWIRIRIQEKRDGFGFSWIWIRGVWIRIRDAWIRTSLVPSQFHRVYAVPTVVPPWLIALTNSAAILPELLTLEGTATPLYMYPTITIHPRI